MRLINLTFMTSPLDQPTQHHDGFRSQTYLEGNVRAIEVAVFRALGIAFHDTVWLPSDRNERVKTVIEGIRGRIR